MATKCSTKCLRNPPQPTKSPESAAILRRSPRFLHPYNSPEPPATPNFKSTTSSNKQKLLHDVKECRVGSRNCAKLANGSRRIPRLRGEFDGDEVRLRRSSRVFCGDEIGQVGGVKVELRRVGVREISEKKREGNDDCREIWGDLERRVTRSCAKEQVRKLELVDGDEGNPGYSLRRRRQSLGSSLVSPLEIKGRMSRGSCEQMGKLELVERSRGDSLGRRTRSLVLALATPLQSKGKKSIGSHEQMGKLELVEKDEGNQRDSLRRRRQSLATSPVTPLRSKDRKSKGSHERDAKEDDSYERCGVVSERRITRSCTREERIKMELIGKDKANLERRITRSCTRDERAKMQLIGNVGRELRKRTQSSMASLGVGEEGEEKDNVDIDGEEEQDASRKKLQCEFEEASVDLASLTVTPIGKKGIDICEDARVVEVKRKENYVEGVRRNKQGWTKEQELALQKAYFVAKPTPHFWKRVAKLVPGKSAQECFDKYHSDNPTPPLPRPRSRAKQTNSPSYLTFSASKLLISTEPKRKRPSRSNRSTHVAQRTVRHLLQKQFHVSQPEPDLFSVLEPSVNPSVQNLELSPMLSTPFHVEEGPLSSSRFHERSSLKKRRSRFSSPITSPPVLKKMKDMALHEKYIDKLHIREAKRKANGLRSQKTDDHPIRDVSKAAKNALVSDATDVISRFQHSQANIMESSSSSDDGFNDEEDENDVLL